jgi:hypothetical protein
LEARPGPEPHWRESNRRTILPALEGGGDLRPALLKNRRTHDHEQPQGGEEDEGAQCCNHRIDPSWKRLTKLDPLCSS